MECLYMNLSPLIQCRFIYVCVCKCQTCVERRSTNKKYFCKHMYVISIVRYLTDKINISCFSTIVDR